MVDMAAPHLCLLGDANSPHTRRWALEMRARGWRVSLITARPELLAWYERRGYVQTGERRPFPMNDPRFGLPKVFRAAGGKFASLAGKLGTDTVIAITKLLYGELYGGNLTKRVEPSSPAGAGSASRSLKIRSNSESRSLSSWSLMAVSRRQSQLAPQGQRVSGGPEEDQVLEVGAALDLGDARLAAVCASRRSDCATSSFSCVQRTTFTATTCLVWTCRARYTAPNPPCPRKPRRS